ncbi:hypothetical protein HMPREF1624_07512 [Sporothrix schenckii ATCC 58251]|uniref:Fibronectin type-III domain-containing protein n=1 Tax=Sporothrix schenckii (strain ATCC 58251 / de Perez 2211183) TaxID=1391915 RepID=U7PK99_SPOS1|nr:hypothetical protein HMPREF1624_07512 [Sporothrix schenckii ATCC 58251]
MLWATWTNTPLVSSLVLCSLVVLIWAVDPQIIQLNVLFVFACLALLFSLAPERTAAVFEALPGIATALINDYHLGGLFFTNARMLFTGAAAVWLLRRGLQTLWKPVPELIDILGVDVPAPPDVSLTAIGVDKATITWTRPPSNRHVDKYVIQVNGVNVGESATSHDTFITVSGLKPNHFYNVRIIAVGANNFQAGSRVLRLRTFGSDGRPRLGTSRLPSDFTEDDAASASKQHEAATGTDENGSIKQFVTSTFGVAQPLPSESPQALSREGTSLGSLAPSSRRNTVNRRHSPSTASLEQQQQFNGAAAAPTADDETGVTEAQMAELNQRYLALRKETEEATAACAKEEEEMKKTIDELEAEKQAKRKEHKRKEEQTEKLKREQGATERAMRNAISRRAQKEKRLKEKTAELERIRNSIEKWTKSIQEMRENQEDYNKQRTELDEEYQRKVNELRESNKNVQEECAKLEAELKEKRRLVKELEDERTKLESHGEDPGMRNEIMALKRQLQRMENEYRGRLNHENRRRDGLDAHILVLSAQMQQIPQPNYGAYNHAASPPMMPNMMSPPSVAQSMIYDYDPTAASHPTHLKQERRASNPLSSGAVSTPAPVFAHTDLNGLPPSSTPPFVSSGRPPTQSGGFLTGPFMGSSADHPGPEDADAGFKALTMGAPLSPSATSLLPSNIFADDEPPSPSLNVRTMSPFIPLDAQSPDILGSLNSFTNSNGNNNNHKATDSSSSHGSQENSNSNNSSNSGNPLNNTTGFTSTDSPRTFPESIAAGAVSGPQSPASSHRSKSIFSSPHASSQNLPFSSYGIEGFDGRPPPTSALPSPTADPATVSGQPASSTRFNLFSFQRSRAAKAAEEGPALGTLKHGQSQSFPRQGEDAEGSKNRRISLSAWSMFNRNSAGPEIMEHQFGPDGQPINKAGGFSARNLFPFGARGGNVFADRDTSSPRPASMASIDMPRPSTDSGSIWGPPVDNGAAGAGLGKASRLWPPDNAWPSRNPSRRPSIHGSPSALKTNLASADDEILDEEELLNPETSPSQVGVIGSRPPVPVPKVNKTLNPAAPTFMANIFRPKGDKDKDHKDKAKDKPKGKDKGKDKSKGRDKERTASKEHRDSTEVTAGTSVPSLVVEDSPSVSRMSRDGLSVHTQASVSVSESRDSLDYVVSNTTSEPNSVGMLSSSKDSSENALLKLFKKDSTGKLSFPRRIGRSKGGGAGSMAGSDKNASVSEQRSSFGDFDDMGDESVLSAASSRRTGMSVPLAAASSVSTSGGGADSVTSSPSLGPSKSSRDGNSNGKSEGGKLKGTGWFSMKKKNREKESLDIDRERERSLHGLGLGEPDSTVSSLATTTSNVTDESDRKA